MNIELPRKELDLSSAIAEGDIRVLLMVLVHMTGDERWLEPPYKPKRDVRLIPEPDAGLPPEIQDKIRAAVLNLFAHGTPRPVIADPGEELMLKMMRACLGENVAPEYAPLMREEMGFVAREARWSRRPGRSSRTWCWNMWKANASTNTAGSEASPSLRASNSFSKSPGQSQSPIARSCCIAT